jgi:hypothetical protein
MTKIHTQLDTLFTHEDQSTLTVWKTSPNIPPLAESHHISGTQRERDLLSIAVILVASVRPDTDSSFSKCGLRPSHNTLHSRKHLYRVEVGFNSSMVDIRRDITVMNGRSASNPWNQRWCCTRGGIEKAYLPMCLSFLSSICLAVDHLIHEDSDMSRDPHQTDFKLLRIAALPGTHR